VPHIRRSPRTESLRSPPIQIPLATIIVLSAKPKGIRCTFVLSSNHSLTTKRSPYSKPTIFARTASPVGTSSGSANQYTSARYATLLHIDQQNLTPPAGSQISVSLVHFSLVQCRHEAKVECFTHDVTCVCHRSRWLISGSQSAAGQCFVRVIRLKFFLCLGSINTFECLALVVCCKGPLSSQFPASKSERSDPIKERYGSQLLLFRKSPVIYL
jgi:hypothetical protein